MTTQTTAAPKTTCITPPAIASYAYVWQARPSLNPGGDPQYSCTLLFDKKTMETPEFKEMRRCAMAAAKKKFGEKLPKALVSPFHDGDEEKPDDPMFKGKIYINAKSKTKPGIVGPDLQPVANEFDFYSGCLCRASVYFYGYDTAGNKGVSLLLNNLQKLGDGTRMSGGRKPAEEDFDAVEPMNGGAAVEDGIPF